MTGNFSGFIGIGVLAALLATLEHSVLLRLSQTDTEPAARKTAPELAGDETWLNSDGRRTLRDFRGKVVVLDFRTHEDAEGVRIHPDLRHVEDKYRTDPVAVVAVYSPAPGYEDRLDGLLAAIRRHDLSHPVLLDVRNRVRNAYGVRASATRVVIDPEGGIVGVVAGDGNQRLLDRTVARLLSEHRDRGTLVERRSTEMVCSAKTVR